jgi:hypothetical protein
MRAYDIAACVVAGAALLLALPPLGKRLRRAIMSTLRNSLAGMPL